VFKNYSQEMNGWMKRRLSAPAPTIVVRDYLNLLVVGGSLLVLSTSGQELSTPQYQEGLARNSFVRDVK